MSPSGAGRVQERHTCALALMFRFRASVLPLDATTAVDAMASRTMQ